MPAAAWGSSKLNSPCSAGQPTSAARASMRALTWEFATGMVAVGLVSSPGIFKVGICLQFAMLGEWLIKNWSDRASSNPAYNEKVRAWVVHPLEIPVGGSLLLAVIVLSFSRIM